jgi:hypothetical protein
VKPARPAASQGGIDSVRSGSGAASSPQAIRPARDAGPLHSPATLTPSRAKREAARPASARAPATGAWSAAILRAIVASHSIASSKAIVSASPRLSPAKPIAC